jgi:hypothetical protein
MLWMMWSVEKSFDPFGVAYYRNKYGQEPNQAEVPLDFPEDQVQALAGALHIPPEQIVRTRHCIPGVIFLAHKISEEEQKETTPCCT